jgi:hypothetical protein
MATYIVVILMATTILVEKETRERLRSFGKKGETYDQILRRLMSLAEYEEFMENQYERLKDKEAFLSLDEI